MVSFSKSFHNIGNNILLKLSSIFLCLIIQYKFEGD